jgi:hypothetical protein
MKKLILILLITLSSCNQNKTHDGFCLKKIEYINQRKKLIPSIVKIQIEDVDGYLAKKIQLGKLKNVILYSVKKNERRFFYLTSFDTGKQYKIENEIIIIPIITTLFEEDLGVKLSEKEIERKIIGDIGLIFDKDTIRIKRCKN